MAASQDYRDGVTFGALEVARRAAILQSLGLDPDDTFITHIANQLTSEYGGVVPDGFYDNYYGWPAHERTSRSTGASE